MFANSVITLTPAEDGNFAAAHAGLSRMGKATNSMLHDLLATDGRTVVLGKGGRTTGKWHGYRGNALTRFKFDAKKVGQALDGLELLVVGEIGGRVRHLDKVPFNATCDALSVRFSTPFGHEDIVKFPEGALGFIANRIEWALTNHLGDVDGLLVCIYNVGDEHPRDYYVSTLLPTATASRIWPAVMNMVWRAAECHPRILFYHGMHIEEGMPSLVF